MSSFLHLSRPVIHGGFTLWLRDACDQNVSPQAGGLKVCVRLQPDVAPSREAAAAWTP